jgi:heat-inducible transcriptional repressor
MYKEELTGREKSILRCIIQQFILTAAPVGSRYISKKDYIGLSPASIRNIMSDLEEMGFIDHPHTSAGRIPTDKGYRYYVDSLMEIQKLKAFEKSLISKKLEPFQQADELLSIASKILSSITNQVACVLYPKLDTGILEQIRLVPLTSKRLLVVVSIKSGLVKTITLELTVEINESHLNEVQSLLSERLSGLKLSEIRKTFSERFKDIQSEDKPIITLFLDSADKIFTDFKTNEKVVISGTSNIFRQPEFDNPERFQGIIELIEDKNIIVHIFEKKSDDPIGEVLVSIGSENEARELEDYSFVKKEYSVDDVTGTLGIIGPKRMEYSKVMAIVDYMANILTDYFKRE